MHAGGRGQLGELSLRSIRADSSVAPRLTQALGAHLHEHALERVPRCSTEARRPRTRAGGNVSAGHRAQRHADVEADVRAKSGAPERPQRATAKSDRKERPQRATPQDVPAARTETRASRKPEPTGAR